MSARFMIFAAVAQAVLKQAETLSATCTLHLAPRHDGSTRVGTYAGRGVGVSAGSVGCQVFASFM